MLKLLALLTLLITLLMGVVIGQLRTTRVFTTAAEPAIVNADPAFDDALAYYRAVNKLLLSGDPVAFRNTLAPGFIDHSNLRAEPGDSVTLERELTLLRALGSGPQVKVSEVVSESGIVAVRVKITHRSMVEDLDLHMTAGANSENYELLRIIEGKVAERWASTSLPGVVQPVSSLEVPQGAGTLREARLEQISLSPSAEITVEHHWGTMLFVKSGSIHLNTNLAGEPQPHAAESASIGLVNETLTPGMVRPVEASMPFQLRNTSSRPATLLWLTIREIGTGMPALAGDEGVDSGAEADVTVSVIAAGATIRPQVGAFTLEAHQVELAAGSVLTLDQTPESTILLVESGVIGVNVQSGLALKLVENGATTPVEGQLLLDQDEAVVSLFSSDLEYQVDERLPATALLFTVEPDTEFPDTK